MYLERLLNRKNKKFLTSQNWAPMTVSNCLKLIEHQDSNSSDFFKDTHVFGNLKCVGKGGFRILHKRSKLNNGCYEGGKT